MTVITCQGFGGPNAQPHDGPSPRRCQPRGEHWVTVHMTAYHGGRAFSEAVVLMCPWHYYQVAEGRS